MKLLIKSLLRHMKQHLCQTILTFLVTLIVSAVLSTVFQVVSSFQALLREYAIETVGSYHYCYNTLANSATAVMYEEMAEQFKKDAFFSEVELEEENGIVYLKLTVDNPGMFMTRQMEEKFERYESRFRAEYEREASYVAVHSREHNYELLVSYGDLHKSNGMYSFLVVFLLVFSVITVSAVLTLGAVFQVSATQRERDFALLISVGASRKQIKYMLWMESMLYIFCALPFGFLLGLVLFELSKEALDNLLSALFDFPPIQLVISAPCCVMMLISAVLIYFFSVWNPARKVEHMETVTALRQNTSICITGKEIKKETTITKRKILGMPGWLAWKNQTRFRRRYRPVALVMTVTTAVCFVMTGFQQFTTEIADISYGVSKNIEIQLQGNCPEKLNKMVTLLTDEAKGDLYSFRNVILRLEQEYPLSKEGEKSEFLGNTMQVPDVSFVSIGNKEYEEICRLTDVECKEGVLEGILVTAERQWISADKIYQGVPFDVSVGDRLLCAVRKGWNEEKEILEFTVAGVWNEFPAGVEVDSPTRLLILVSEDVLLELEKKQNSAEAIHSITLCGFVDEPESLEKFTKKWLDISSEVTGKVYNFEEENRRDMASIAGFSFLMTGLVCMLVTICMGGNFIVTWTMGNARKREFAILVSLGMTQREIRCMRWLEQISYYGMALVPGCIIGTVCYWYIYDVYSRIYLVTWCLPWKGFTLSLLITLFAVLFTEAVMFAVSGKRSVAELLKIDEI